MSKKRVIFDHDGAIDDFLALILLLTMPEIELLGIVVTPADCYIQAALSVTDKILNLLGRRDIAVSESTVRGINAFPPKYRQDCLIIDNFPILNEQEIVSSSLVKESGQEFLVNTLIKATTPVTLMVTGPLTTVATALEIEPKIIDKIDEIVWMGGALNVPGNVEKAYAPEHDGSAEWNAYWDPMAVAQIWQTNIPLVVCPLDITNTVPVTSEFIRTLSKQRNYVLSDLAGLCYSLAIPQNYYCWDILATAYLARPEYYRLRQCETQVIERGSSQGRIKIVSGGRKIQAMENVDRDRFYAYLLEQWRYNSLTK
ncbi:MAG: nucleoside hydrolase [Waterburya sp.]